MSCPSGDQAPADAGYISEATRETRGRNGVFGEVRKWRKLYLNTVSSKLTADRPEGLSRLPTRFVGRHDLRGTRKLFVTSRRTSVAANQLFTVDHKFALHHPKVGGLNLGTRLPSLGWG